MSTSRSLRPVKAFLESFLSALVCKTAGKKRLSVYGSLGGRAGRQLGNSSEIVLKLNPSEIRCGTVFSLSIMRNTKGCKGFTGRGLAKCLLDVADWVGL